LSVVKNITCGNSTNASSIFAYGNITANGNVQSVSDVRLKEDIQTVTSALDILTKLRGVTFYWKNKTTSGEKQYGVIAQEVEEVLPELVNTVSKEGEETIKVVNYNGLISPMIEAIKEQQQEIQEQQQEIQEQKLIIQDQNTKIETQGGEITDLKNLVNSLLERVGRLEN